MLLSSPFKYCMNCKMLQQAVKGDSDVISSSGDFKRFNKRTNERLA